MAEYLPRRGGVRRRHGAIARRGYALRRDRRIREPRLRLPGQARIDQIAAPGGVSNAGNADGVNFCGARSESAGGSVPNIPAARRAMSESSSREKRKAPPAPPDGTPQRPNQIVHRLRGVIRNSRTALSSFMHGWEHSIHGEQHSARCQDPARKPDSDARGNGLFPCAAPAWDRSDRPRSSRRAARWRRRLAACNMVSIILGVSSWLSLGSRSRCPARLPAPTTPAHDLALAHIEKSAFRWIRLIESSPDLVGSGRRGPAVARQLDALRGWLNECGNARDGYGPVKGGPAPIGAVETMPLVPDRMALPQHGATFDLAAWLPEPVRSEFERPKAIRRRDVPAAPRSRVHSSDWPGVLRKLDDAHMLLLAREEDIPRDGYGRIPRNGAFSVRKDADWDRVVCARKPSNSLETPSKQAGGLLPHGSQVCEKQLGPGVDWIFEKDDLDNMYHKCATSYEQALTTPIGPALSTVAFEGTQALDEARARESMLKGWAPRSDKWQPCLSSLPMGHVRAVDWAQLGHSNFLRAHGGLLDSEVLLYRASAPRSATWDGVMLDDRVIMREAPRGTKLGESRQAAAAVQAYPRFGLEAKASKRERDAIETEFWGAHVHGGEGWARVNDSGMRRPVGASLALCELGAVSGDLWRSCRSLWPNALLYRRCGLGLLDHIYSFDPPDGHVARIPQRVKSELLALVALSPLFWTNLRAPVSTELGASDASDGWCAVVTAMIGERTAAELWRVRDKRAGCYVRCETDVETMLRRAWNEGDHEEQIIAAAVCAMTDDELPDLSEHEKRFSWVSDLADSLGWNEVVRYRASFREHINMKELRAYRTRLRHAARRTECHGTRRLTLLDSSVVRGTASKGRSSSRRLNRIWKPVVPELLAADIQDGTLPVPTKHMPADGATRNRLTRAAPVRPPPSWLTAPEASDYKPFDAIYAASTRQLPKCFFPAVSVEDEACPPLPLVSQFS